MNIQNEILGERSAFFFITNEVEFQESTQKGARVYATFMELNKPSGNDRIYRIEEGEQLAKSLIGKPIRFGANILGKHYKSVPKIGFVESAKKIGNKIKGIVNIFDEGVIKKLKDGVKFLFSVGGTASFGQTIKKGKKMLTKLWGAVCSHLQLLPNNPAGAGFPNAKMHKIIEVNESVMLTDATIKICDGDQCILCNIKDEIEYEEAKKQKIMDSIKTKAINRAIANEILSSIKAGITIFEKKD